MKTPTIVAAVAGLALAACETPVAGGAGDGPIAPPAAGFTVPGADGTGGWVRLCITEMRYKNFTIPYGLSGFASEPGGTDHFFALTKSGIIMSPSSTPALVPSSEWYDADETPDLWGFLRHAADEGKWVEFYAWDPDPAGVQRVTQVRRQYPSPESAPCPQ